MFLVLEVVKEAANGQGALRSLRLRIDVVLVGLLVAVIASGEPTGRTPAFLRLHCIVRPGRRPCPATSLYSPIP